MEETNATLVAHVGPWAFGTKVARVQVAPHVAGVVGGERAALHLALELFLGVAAAVLDVFAQLVFVGEAAAADVTQPLLVVREHHLTLPLAQLVTLRTEGNAGQGSLTIDAHMRRHPLLAFEQLSAQATREPLAELETQQESFSSNSLCAKV